ncbi:MAG: metallophosphoesterase [Clostridia bacterium]|nr:metallophosphoesterase [Clostridia bacterium]
MKTAVVLSDTHGNRKAIDKLAVILGECDYIIHLGDTSEDGAYIRSNYGNKTFLVNGNCDRCKLGEDELVLDIEGVRIFATHGHLYGAKSGTAKLLARAKELGCSVVLYGHTHDKREDEIDGITVINPGCMTRYSQGSYCYLAIFNGKAVAKIVENAGY